MIHTEIEEYILSFADTWLDHPFGEASSVYKVGNKVTGEGNMYAVIQNGTKPLRVSLKCDPILAETLRAKYETVVPGFKLNKKNWNTIICSGQLDDEEIKDLVRLSYNLAVSK